MLASDILTPARGTLLDASAVAWSDAELLGYLNEGIRETVLVKPDVYPVRGALALAAGIVQVLPADGVVLIDITHNVASGRVVTVTDLALLQEANRFYPAATQQAEVENFATDPRDPRRYIVFPPNNAAGSVYAVYGGTPAGLATTGDTFPLTDVYQPPLISYVLSRAYAKNSKRQDLTKAAAYRQQWAQGLGMKSAATVAAVPHVSQSPGL